MSRLMISRRLLLPLPLLYAPLRRLLPKLSTLAISNASSVSSSSSPAVPFLVVDSRGLHLSSSLSAAESLPLPLKDLHEHHPVLALLKSHGFSPSQIADLLARRPAILRCRPERTLKPKFSFFLSEVGVPPAALPTLVLSNPTLLSRSLDYHLRPSFDLLRCFLTSADDVLLICRRNKWFLTCNLRGTVIPNITHLLNLGVPVGHISKLLTTHPRTLMQRPKTFSEAVETVGRMGINPKLSLFVHAVRAVNGMTKSTWKTRLGMLEKMGWSLKQIQEGFCRAPLFVLVSERKMSKSVDFLVKEVGLGPAELSRQPKLLMYSLERRIVPRFEVYKLLREKGLVGKANREKKLVLSMFVYGESCFLGRFVEKYQEKVPELMEVYHAKLGVAELDPGDGEDAINI